MEHEHNMRILMLEDVKDDVLIIERVLRKEGISFTSFQADTREEFIEAIDTFKPDVILSDHALPQFNSIEAYKIYKEKELSIPFILVTGTVSEEFAVTCLKLGIDDYILKSNLSRLPSAIRGALKQRQLEQHRRFASKTLQDQNYEISKINKELDSFIYSISHSLRGPVSTAMGLLNLTEYEAKSANNELKQLHGLMKSCVQQLDITLGQMLEYSRNARLELEVQSIDLEALLQKCFDNVSYMEGASSLQKEIHSDTQIPFYSDIYRIEIIFNSILSNTIKYRKTGRNDSKIEIQIQTTPEAAIISFQDNGTGINEQVIPKVYNMFFRGSERSDGAGLGLYITKECVEKLNGYIHISSIENKRTTVYITLPNMNPDVQTGNRKRIPAQTQDLNH